MERELVVDPRIRTSCRDQHLAVIFLSCGLKQADLQKVLDDLAGMSGYEELGMLPLLFVGHSAGGPQANVLATRFADRCFGLIQYRGGFPNTDATLPPGIPALAMNGQFDEFGKVMRNESGFENWERYASPMADFRALGEDRLACMVIEPGAGHFAWSARNAAFASEFIRNAARLIEAPDDPARPPRVPRPNPRNGWLTPLSPKHEPTAAPFARFRGDRVQTSWHFHEVAARSWIAYHRGLTGKKDQFIEWQDSHWVESGARFFFNELKWVGDGRSFEVHPRYADKYPTQYKGRGPKWHRAGKPVGNSGAPIHLRKVGGPLVHEGGNRFRVHHDALVPAGSGIRGTFLAFSDGNDEYRYTERVGMMPRKFTGLEEGVEQTITFPALSDLVAGAPPLELKATSDAGLPVAYYVARGPAVIEEGRLVLRDVPARAAFPIEIEVVAWQHGRPFEPRVRTAAPVSQTIELQKN